MKHCETCKHWGEPYWVKLLEVRHCEAVPEVWEASEWDEYCDSRIVKESYANTLAFAADGSDYKADLYTRAEYGCPMHEERQS